MDKTRIATKQTGFAIIELLIIVVVIGVLSVITVNNYINDSSNKKQNTITVKQEASDASLQSDLANASNLLKIYQAEHDAYPESIDCSSSPTANSICLRPSEGNKFSYSVKNSSAPQTFELTATNSNSGISYKITNNN
jgi:Tfp pilus assembly protein PilE